MKILGLPVLYRYPHVLHQYLLSWIFNDILKSFRFPCKHIAALNIGGYLAIHNIHIYRIIFSLEPLSDCLVAPPSGSYWHANSVQTPHITSRLTYSIDWLLKTLSKQLFWENKKIKKKTIPIAWLLKHCKTCECCPVSLLITKLQTLSTVSRIALWR